MKKNQITEALVIGILTKPNTITEYWEKTSQRFGISVSEPNKTKYSISEVNSVQFGRPLSLQLVTMQEQTSCYTMV